MPNRKDDRGSDAAEARDVAATGRDVAAENRDDLAVEDDGQQDAADDRLVARDRTAAAADRRAAASRDQRASARDAAAEARDLAAPGASDEQASNRVLAASDRAAAALDRRDEASGASAALARDDAAQARDAASTRRRTAAAADDRTHAADDRAAAALDRAGSETDRRLATDQVRHAEQALAAIIRSSPDAVIDKNLEGVITSWNDGATGVYGRSAEEMVGRSWEVLVPPEALGEERARHQRVAAGMAESGYHCVRLRADGQRIEVVMSMSPIFDEAGAVSGVASLSRPISADERDIARFASLLEAAPDAIVCVDAQGRIATVNAQVAAMFGYDREELVGRDVEVLLPEETSSRHVDLRSAYLLEPQVRAMGTGLALHGRRRDGSEFPIEVSLAPDRAQAETIVIAVIRDMTEQRRLERDVRESETRLRQLAENVNVVFILRQIDPPEVLYVSPAAASVLGRAPSDWMHASGELTVHPSDREWVERDFLPAMVAGRAADAEFRVIMPDGAARWVCAISAPVPNPHGSVERSVVTIENITDRVLAVEALRETEAEARAANDAKNQFLSRMSHELRTPLNAILGFGQLLEIEFAGTKHAAAVLQILKGGRHLLGLIDDVLDISRIETGDMEISNEPVAVRDVVAECLQLMAPLAARAGVQVLPTTSFADIWVMADRRRLSQVMLNLLSNAIKYNEAGGQVWIEATEADQRVVITVRDDGPGIDAALMSRLFTPFDRLGAERRGIEGTGIGLPLTRALARLMGGDLTAESTRERGSAFSVTLTASAALPAELEVSTIEVAVADLPPDMPGSRTLLYIEDNEANVRVIDQLLKLRPAWRLIHSSLGGLGVELAQAHVPDMVLLDLHLPDITGQDVLRQLKSILATRNIPVVVLTADASPHTAAVMFDAGALRFLTKPFDVTELLGILDDVDGRT